MENAKEISDIVQLVAFQRSGYEVNGENIEKYNFILLDNTPIHASSEAREGCIKMLNESVIHYIFSKGLYLNRQR